MLASRRPRGAAELLTRRPPSRQHPHTALIDPGAQQARLKAELVRSDDRAAAPTLVAPGVPLLAIQKRQPRYPQFGLREHLVGKEAGDRAGRRYQLVRLVVGVEPVKKPGDNRRV